MDIYCEDDYSALPARFAIEATDAQFDAYIAYLARVTASTNASVARTRKILARQDVTR